MKRYIIFLSSILLLAAMVLSTLAGCSPEVKKDKDYLYNWLLENGELANGTELMYKDGEFTLRTDHSQEMVVEYIIPDYNGYKITVRLPLYSKSDKASAVISVHKRTASSSLTYYHTAKNFTKKSPISYGTISSYPQLETINKADYGTSKYENGMFVFYFDASKWEEYEQKIKANKEISAQQELRESIAKDLAHEALCDILDWLNEEICPSAKMDVSEFGYKAYK